MRIQATRRHRIFNRGNQATEDLANTLKDKIRRDLIQELDTVIATWEHKCEWEWKFVHRGGQLILEIFSAGEHEMIFQYVDKGTDPHGPIVAVNVPMLVFNLGYSPKTAYRGLNNVGTGDATGLKVVTPVVQTHPGNDPRDFSGKIADDYMDEMVDNLQGAARGAFRI